MDFSEHDKPGAPADGTFTEQTQQKGAERRRHPRAAIELVVRMRFGTVDQLVEATARDISLGGMFISGAHVSKSGAPRPIGQTLTLQFDAGGDRVVEGQVKIVRIVQGFGIGVEFIDLDGLSAQLIEAVVCNSTT